MKSLEVKKFATVVCKSCEGKGCPKCYNGVKQLYFYEDYSNINTIDKVSRILFSK